MGSEESDAQKMVFDERMAGDEDACDDMECDGCEEGSDESACANAVALNSRDVWLRGMTRRA